jgi:hypothetical protein
LKNRAAQSHLSILTRAILLFSYPRGNLHERRANPFVQGLSSSRRFV